MELVICRGGTVDLWVNDRSSLAQQAVSVNACVRAKSLQSCPTLCSPMDCSLPGSPVRGNLQARILKTLPFPLPGYLPDSRIEPTSLVSCSLPLAPPGKPLNTVSQLYFNKLFLKRTIGWSYSMDKGVGLRF